MEEEMISSLKRLGFISLGSAFVLAACAQDKPDLQTQNQQLKTQNQQLEAQNAELSKQVSSLNAQVTRLQDAIKYTVNSDLLFSSGSWEMSPSGEKIIAQIASQLAPTQQRKLVVNGYTDNAPIGRRLEQAGITSNEMLSQKRAEAVMKYMISRGVQPDLVAAKGWGEARPVGPNDTPAGRAQNRRVEITLAPGA
jgi:chemotaxis protein MotB